MPLIMKSVWSGLLVVALLGGGTHSQVDSFMVARKGSVDAARAILRAARA